MLSVLTHNCLARSKKELITVTVESEACYGNTAQYCSMNYIKYKNKTNFDVSFCKICTVEGKR